MRESGILLHITSLPEKGGIGTMGQAAYDFVDFIKECGLNIWQVLPVGPVGYGESPYQSVSTYAGNPLLIDLKTLEKDGYLEAGSYTLLPDSDQVDFEAVRREKEKALRLAFANKGKETDMAVFIRENPWVEDYGLFMALKMHFGGGTWQKWPMDVRMREEKSMQKWREELKDEIAYYIFVQYLFFDQWFKLRKYANDRGIRLFGDMPIYVAEDSADMWANPDAFQLDEERKPLKVAGVPPDYFCADGQLWGNPLYNWKAMKKRKFDWWINRMRAMGKLYDMVRVDHFIGFANYYSIPYGHQTAEFGHWEKGPGIELFRRAEEVLGWHEVIAEDLGFVTDSVRQLVRDSGFPGMKVLQFAFDSRDTGSARDYLPHNYTENAVVYTGTHDNDTTIGWFEAVSDDDWNLAREYLCDFYTPDEEMDQPFVALALQSIARMCIIPMQDYLGLGTEARMNTPSTIGCNWRWRMTDDQFTQELCRDILARTRRYGRTDK